MAHWIPVIIGVVVAFVLIFGGARYLRSRRPDA